jgi:hypothetical protein
VVGSAGQGLDDMGDLNIGVHIQKTWIGGYTSGILSSGPFEDGRWRYLSKKSGSASREKDFNTFWAF